MDDQHGILMDAMNELRVATVRGAGRQQVSALLNQLIEFFRMHFVSEERLMEQYGFPGVAGHRAEHRRLQAHLLKFAHVVQHGEIIPMKALLGCLRDWYTEHIENLDHQYAPWLNDLGIY